MAVGEHWEWRGFGVVPSEARRRILTLPSQLVDPPWQLVDHYLWAPGCTMNVKLRGNASSGADLKLKRFVAAHAGLERWLEDEQEIFAFPLAWPVLQRVIDGLGISVPDALVSNALARAFDRPSFLKLLNVARPPVQVISVRKARWLQALPVPGQVTPVTVELAEITAPERVTTVGVEHGDAQAVHDALAWLEVEALSLYAFSYLQALEVWARGESVAQA